MKPFTLWLPEVYHYTNFIVVSVTCRINSWEVICSRFINPIYNTDVGENRVTFQDKEYFVS